MAGTAEQAVPALSRAAPDAPRPRSRAALIRWKPIVIHEPVIRPRVGLPVAAALLVLACSEADDSPAVAAREPLDVVLVTWDTVRWDHVGTSGRGGGVRARPSHTPTWDRFAREGVRFTEARTTAPVTLSAHASILTGLDPPRHGARDNGIFTLRATVPTLAEEFARAGYLTAAFVSAEVLHPRHGLDRGFERYDYFVHRAEHAHTVPERRADKTVDTALAWLARAPTERPLFLWVHLFDPHRPWDAPAPWRDRYDPYRAEIAFADAQTGRLLDHLAGLGRLRRSLVVITSDHGEGLGEHGETSHAYFAYDSTMRVPLLFWAGARTGISLAPGARIDGIVSLVDLAPTLRALSGLPERPDGRSLARSAPGRRAARGSSASVRVGQARDRVRNGADLRSPDVEGRGMVRSAAPRALRHQTRPGTAREPLQGGRRSRGGLPLRAILARLAALRRARSISTESRERLAALGCVIGSAPRSACDSVAAPMDHGM